MIGASPMSSGFWWRSPPCPAFVMASPARAGFACAFLCGGWCWGAWKGEVAPRAPGDAFSEGAFPGIGRGGKLPNWHVVYVYKAGPRLWSRTVTSEAERLQRARYRRSAKGKATASRYKLSAKGKAANARYRQSEKGKATAAKARARHKERSASGPTNKSHLSGQ